MEMLAHRFLPASGTCLNDPWAYGPNFTKLSLFWEQLKLKIHLNL